MGKLLLILVWRSYFVLLPKKIYWMVGRRFESDSYEFLLKTLSPFELYHFFTFILIFNYWRKLSSQPQENNLIFSARRLFQVNRNFKATSARKQVFIVLEEKLGFCDKRSFREFFKIFYIWYILQYLFRKLFQLYFMQFCVDFSPRRFTEDLAEVLKILLQEFY